MTLEFGSNCMLLIREIVLVCNLKKNGSTNRQKKIVTMKHSWEIVYLSLCALVGYIDVL